VVHWIRLGLPLNHVLAELKEVLKPGNSSGRVIGELVCQELISVLRNNEELDSFIGLVNQSWARIKNSLTEKKPLNP